MEKDRGGMAVTEEFAEATKVVDAGGKMMKKGGVADTALTLGIEWVWLLLTWIQWIVRRVVASYVGAEEERTRVGSDGSSKAEEGDGDVVRGGGLGRGKTVLVTTGRQAKSLHVVRALAQTGARVIVADYQPVSMSAVSRHCDRFYLLPALDARQLDAWIDALAAILRREKVDLVVPVSTINEVLFMGAAKDRLRTELPCTQWLCPGLQLSMDLDDRCRFAQLCQQHGVTTPEQGLLTETTSRWPWQQSDDAAGFDVMLKRLESSVNREEEIVRVAAGAAPPPFVQPSADDPWQWQRLVRGREFSAWYVVHDGRVTLSACYPSQPDLVHFDGFAVPADVDAMLRRFLAELGYTGQVAFDYFYDEERQEATVIECNPRASSILETIDATPLWGEALLGVDVRRRTVYRDVGFVFHRNCWPWTRRAEAIWSWTDPLPFLVGELLWPLCLLQRVQFGPYHHIDVNIGKIVTGGRSTPRKLAVFASLLEDQRVARIAGAVVPYADRVVLDAAVLAAHPRLAEAVLPSYTAASVRIAVAEREPPAAATLEVWAKLVGTSVEDDDVAAQDAAAEGGLLLHATSPSSSLRDEIAAFLYGSARPRLIVTPAFASAVVVAAGDDAGDDDGDVRVLVACRDATDEIDHRVASSYAEGKFVAVSTRPVQVLHLIGSCTSSYYEGVSRLYAEQCLNSVEHTSDVRFVHHRAFVHLDGSWSLDADPSRLSLGEACLRLEARRLDLVVPHMFDYAGMTTYRELCTLLGAEIVGCPPEVVGLSTHKGRTKAVLAQAGVGVPQSVSVTRPEGGAELGAVALPFPFPVIVKPCEEDNSMGVTFVDDASQLAAALQEAFQFDHEVLVEQFVPLGREMRVGVVEEMDGALRMLATTEYYLLDAGQPIRRPEDKLTVDKDGVPQALNKLHRRTPADDDVSPALRRELHAAATRAHRALGCVDYSLYDVRICPKERAYVLEACLYCSFSPSSALVTMANFSGAPHPCFFVQCCERAVARVDARRRRRRNARGTTQLLGMK